MTTGPLIVVAALGTAGFAVLLWQLRKATTAPLTDTDRWCSHVDQALDERELSFRASCALMWDQVYEALDGEPA